MAHLNKSTPTIDVFLGCDVAKKSIVVFNSKTGETKEIANEPKALNKYLKSVTEVKLLVCEATGGYERKLLSTASELAIKAHRADPLSASQFAKSIRRSAKTDKIDAIALARYGQERYDILPVWTPHSEFQIELKELSHHRDNLVAEQVRYVNQSKAPLESRFVKSSLARLIRQLKKDIASIEAKMDKIIAADQVLKGKFDTICSIKGCAKVTARTLLAYLPELGKVDRKRIASLGGLAPHPKQSGDSSWKKPMSGGREVIKKILFMAAMSASQHNDHYKKVYDQFMADSRPSRVAILAVARQLLVYINYLLRDRNKPADALAS